MQKIELLTRKLKAQNSLSIPREQGKANEPELEPMKKFIPLAFAFSLMFLMTGCLGLQIGGGEKHEVQNATIGQQLMDLKAAKDTGAISDTEYEIQKAKVLGNNNGH
jgi:hypothetical protein